MAGCSRTSNCGEIAASFRIKVGEYRTQELGRKLIERSDGVCSVSKLGENDEKSVIQYAQLQEFRPDSGMYLDSEIGRPTWSAAVFFCSCTVGKF